MSESVGYVGGGGQFMRVRDNASGSFAAEFNRQQKLDEERERQKQAEQNRIAAFRAEEEEKRRAAKDADARKAFREYHNNPASRGGIGSIYRYTEARFGRCYDVDLKQGLAELNSPELLRQYMPERFAQQQGEAELKSDYAKHPKCKFCRIVFFKNEELAAHYRDTRPCPHRCGLCSAGGDIHRCSKYGAAILEDRIPALPARKYEEEKEKE